MLSNNWYLKTIYHLFVHIEAAKILIIKQNTIQYNVIYFTIFGQVWKVWDHVKSSHKHLTCDVEKNQTFIIICTPMWNTKEMSPWVSDYQGSFRLQWRSATVGREFYSKSRLFEATVGISNKMEKKFKNIYTHIYIYIYKEPQFGVL